MNKSMYKSITILMMMVLLAQIKTTRMLSKAYDPIIKDATEDLASIGESDDFSDDSNSDIDMGMDDTDSSDGDEGDDLEEKKELGDMDSIHQPKIVSHSSEHTYKEDMETVNGNGHRDVYEHSSQDGKEQNHHKHQVIRAGNVISEEDEF